MIAPTEGQEPFSRGHSHFGSPSPNEPAPVEIQFVSHFVDRRVSEMERQLEADRLIPAASSTELNRILVAFADLASDDGGNYPLWQRVDRAIGLSGRLALLGFSPGPSRETPLRNRLHRPQFLHRVVELEEYLLELEGLWRAAKPLPTTPPEFAQLADYLVELVAGSQQAEKPVDLVFLLRDTLLLYLGARLLRARGAPITPRAAMISRDLLRQFAEPAPRNPLYATLYNNIFESISSDDERMSDSFATSFAKNWRASKLYGRDSLQAFLRVYLRRILGDGERFTVVDCGTFGTMPLLAMISDRRITDMRLFTAAPWMQDFYAGRVHSAASDRLRGFEQLACHDELFSFASAKGGRIFVNVSLDPAIVSQALAEIHSFLQII